MFLIAGSASRVRIGILWRRPPACLGVY